MATPSRLRPNEFQAGTAVIPSTKVEISVSCRNLRDLDVFSKSDPLCVLYIQDLLTRKYIEAGRTEIIKDNLNPEFAKKFIVDYNFEQCQRLKFELYDVDSSSHRLEQHDFLGYAETTLGEIIGAPGGCILRKLQNKVPGNFGEVILRVEELTSNKEVITVQFRGSNLDQKNWWGLFGKSDPFLTFYRANEDNSYTVVHRTEEVQRTLNPTWKTFTIPLKTLCNGDYNRSVKIECYDWNANGSHELIGYFITNVNEILNCDKHTAFELNNPKSKKHKKAGEIYVVSCVKDIEITFIDYIRGGMQMNFTVAIDFTASNGNPTSPESLHYINPYQPNQYAAAISAVGEIIKDYDSDNMFPALGFGARMPDGNVSHEFPLNFQMNNPFCAGIEGILHAYQNALLRVQLYGPTNFAPVINHVARFASSIRDGSEYFVLLIITDGIITDLPQTTAAIVNASTLPMSIIIVGVGQADFAEMRYLDGDDERLCSQGRYAERDIVQFVAFRDFLTGRGSMDVSRALLAKEVLAEIPDQILSYMNRYRIKPKPPLPSPIPQHRTFPQANLPKNDRSIPLEPPPPYVP
ncbi:copine-8-like [Physella acuta]|uniref:copine-8-like n=1 Tax=Physella acuta TaxID=109671 RepID=UPI0027DD6EDC|nr:copine-8-like [Physella acuta]